MLDDKPNIPNEDRSLNNSQLNISKQMSKTSEAINDKSSVSNYLEIGRNIVNNVVLQQKDSFISSGRLQICINLMNLL